MLLRGHEVLEVGEQLGADARRGAEAVARVFAVDCVGAAAFVEGVGGCGVVVGVRG